jgi:xanthine dehydrogenase accessory factor
VPQSIFHALAEAARAGESIALGIITGVKGSSPQKLGAKAIFHTDRRIQGTLGGGCLEAEAQRLALQSLRDGQPRTFDLVLDHDFGWDDGLICGGKVFGVIIPNAQGAGEKFWREMAERKSAVTWGVKEDFTIARSEDEPAPGARTAESARSQSEQLVDRSVRAPSSPPPADPLTRSPAVPWLYTETITPPCALWIAGSGHIAQAVAPLALQLDFTVSVFDDRPELANHGTFPREVKLLVGPWGELCAAPFPDVPTFGLIVTRGHKHDALVLETWIHRPFAFLGMIGSTRKARTIAEHFIAKKIATAEQMNRVACPVGAQPKHSWLSSRVAQDSPQFPAPTSGKTTAARSRTRRTSNQSAATRTEFHAPRRTRRRMESRAHTQSVPSQTTTDSAPDRTTRRRMQGR